MDKIIEYIKGFFKDCVAEYKQLVADCSEKASENVKAKEIRFSKKNNVETKEADHSGIKNAGIFCLIAVLVGAFGCVASMDGSDLGIVFFCIAGAILLLAIDYLIAKEFEFIAYEKGYNGKKYFWYSFLLTGIGYSMVIALPKKDK